VKRQVGGRTAVRPYDKSFVWPVKSHLWDNLPSSRRNFLGKVQLTDPLDFQ